MNLSPANVTTRQPALPAALEKPHVFLHKARFTIAVVLLALWWGGFSFYAAVVVPTGHAVLRSKIRQGLITQQVTKTMNLLAGAAAIAFVCELYGRRRLSVRTFRVGLGCSVTLVICLLVLLWLHTRLDLLLDPVARSVSNEERFYLIHRVYLIVATLQWVVGLVGLCWLTNRQSA